MDGEDWRGGRFLEVWKEALGQNTALKLTLCEGEEKPLLGIVRLGTAPRLNGTVGALRGSLLEAAPIHRHGKAGQRYRGIGEVLVARLVIESKIQGAEGPVRVRPIRGSEAFYKKLGFITAPNSVYAILEVEKAEALLKLCLLSPTEEQ